MKQIKEIWGLPDINKFLKEKGDSIIFCNPVLTERGMLYIVMYKG